jgi:3-deoxy-manno-octulosonate cytidylyltransferase (CMP-KDO synthetase)
MRVLGVIPARLGSTRLPNKPLQLLAGEPLVTRVVQRVLAHGLVDRLVVATDSPMVAQVAERSGVAAVLTDDRHSTGTERVAEVAARPEFTGYDVIVNIQGDEPFIDREALEGSLARVRGGDEVGTAAATLEAALVRDPARVKVVTDVTGRALYFSRSVIPIDASPRTRAKASTGSISIYAYTRSALERWVRLFQPRQNWRNGSSSSGPSSTA